MKLKPTITARRKLFAEEYLKDLNATQAAIRAGYSAKNAGKIGPETLNNPAVKEIVEAAMAERIKRTQISADNVLEELWSIARADITQAYDEAGWLKPLKDIPQDVRRALSGLEVQEIFTGEGDDRHISGLMRKLRFNDKIKALELVGKHLGLFKERHEHSGPNGAPIAHEVAALTDEQREARIAELLAKRGGK